MNAEHPVSCPAYRPPYRPEGTVYGTLLNFRREQALWAGRMAEPPYNAPPKAPVLYVKTANTFSLSGAAIPLAPDVEAVSVGVSLGLVMGNFESFWHQPSVRWTFTAINIIVYEQVHDAFIPAFGLRERTVVERCAA